MKLEWTEPAVLDLKSTRDYIRRDSEYYAARFVEKVIEAAETLNELPKLDGMFRNLKMKTYGNSCCIIIGSFIERSQNVS
jgi:plasmid stabilization system protein ParE